MKSTLPYGTLNGHSIGIILKELIRRMMDEIRRQRFIFEATTKVGYDGEATDLVTSADKAAQKIAVKILKECFPTFGIVAEEGELQQPCTHPDLDIWISIDPVDGTKAFGRRQSDGVGTMLSMVCNGDVIASYIGDINTYEIYGYRPDSEKVHRLSELNYAEALEIKNKKTLKEQYLLLRDIPEAHSDSFRNIIQTKTGPFKSYEITSGSIGISMARLWKGEVGGAILKSTFITPWDWAPILGISSKLGFVFLAYQPGHEAPKYLEIPVSKEIKRVEAEIVVIHESRASEFVRWQKSQTEPI